MCPSISLDFYVVFTRRKKPFYSSVFSWLSISQSPWCFLSLSDSHEDHAGSHVQASNRTGDPHVHIKNSQEPPHGTGSQLRSVIIQTNLTSDRVEDYSSPSFQFSLLFLFFVFGLMTSTPHHLSSLCLTCDSHYTDTGCLIHSTSWRDRVYVFVRGCAWILFAIYLSCLCGLTERIRHSLFFYIHVMQYDTSTLLSCIFPFSFLLIYSHVNTYFANIVSAGSVGGAALYCKYLLNLAIELRPWWWQRHKLMPDIIKRGMSYVSEMLGLDVLSE